MSRERIDFFLNEYSEISASLRHLNDIRMRMIQFTIAGNGVLFLFLSSYLHKPVAQVQAETQAVTLAIIFLGCAICFLAALVEFFNAKQFGLLTQRGVEIEAEFGVDGPFFLSDAMLRSHHGLSVTLAAQIFYASIVGFWITVLVLL